MLSDKPILMIHEFKSCFLKLPLEQYTLTFDDGLYSQYKYIDELIKTDTDKIFFISSNIVCDEQCNQSPEEISCVYAHEKSRRGDFSNYMKWSQLHEIQSHDRCFIGAHGHDHIKDITDSVKLMINDTKQMYSKFYYHGMGSACEMFCFPYNQESELYKRILSTKAKTKYFYGRNRVDINEIN